MPPDEAASGGAAPGPTGACEDSVDVACTTAAPLIPVSTAVMLPAEATAATPFSVSRLTTVSARVLLASVEATTSLPASLRTRTMKSTITLPSESVKSTSLALTPLPASWAIPCFTASSKSARIAGSLTRDV